MHIYIIQILLLLCFVIKLPLIYTLNQLECSKISLNERLDCHPEQQANERNCTARGCCWKPRNFDEYGIPACYFPKGYPAYNIVSMNETDGGFVLHLTKMKTNYLGHAEVNQLKAEIHYERSTTLRFRITMLNQSKQWEPPIYLNLYNESVQNKQYNVSFENSPFGIRITRTNDSSDVLLDSTGTFAPSLVVADQFLQISFRISSDTGYGIGETESMFPYPLNNWLRLGLWAHDGRPIPYANLYGVHNFFMGLKHDGRAFGVFLLNSNAQEVALTPYPAITYRTIGGILDFFIFTGPTPADVISQYYDVIGRPPVPPYWSLGFHLCRYGQKNLTTVKDTLQRNLNANIPIDALWLDIDYMQDYRVWTVDKIKFNGLREFIENKLHKEYGIRSVLILDPAISTKGGPDYATFNEALKLGLFINDSRTGKPIIGTVWPGETMFPDFSHPSATDWWYSSAKTFYETEAKFDGLWIDMNEPASFNTGSLTNCPRWNKLDNPYFVPRILANSLADRTVCPSALHHDTTHYNRHNLYGYDEARVTHEVLQRLLPGKRQFLLSRSTFAGSGRYTVHWTGDVVATWEAMRTTIIQMINFNMFAIPMVGADICGFDGDTYEELCVRWSQLGAFYPFSRNHNTDDAIDQDPAVWSHNATEAIRLALRLRYHLLPYLYTLFYHSHLNGTTVVRALAFEYPHDLNAHYINEQFMLGSCLLVTPVLHEGRTSVIGYVPKGEWIDLFTTKRLYSSGQRMYFPAPLHVIPVLARAGCVIPFHPVPERTAISRKKGFGLIVILSAVEDGHNTTTPSGTASGELYWDDGDNDKDEYVHIQFNVINRCLTTKHQLSKPNIWNNLDRNELTLKFVFIIGIRYKPKQLLLNQISCDFIHYADKQIVQLEIKQSLTLVDNLQIEWMF